VVERQLKQQWCVGRKEKEIRIFLLYFFWDLRGVCEDGRLFAPNGWCFLTFSKPPPPQKKLPKKNSVCSFQRLWCISQNALRCTFHSLTHPPYTLFFFPVYILRTSKTLYFGSTGTELVIISFIISSFYTSYYIQIIQTSKNAHKRIIHKPKKNTHTK
jgi:hypothetical protein